MAQGKAAPNSALFVLREGAFMALLSQRQQAKELSVVFTPVPATGDSPNRSHLIQIRAEQQVTPTTAGVPLWGALRLSHTTVTSKKCHLPAPHHCTCSAGQEQLLALTRYPMPRGDASRLQARMELDSVLAALPKSPQPHTLHRAMHVLPCAQASAHRDRECCQLQ